MARRRSMMDMDEYSGMEGPMHESMETPRYERAEEREGYTGGVKPPMYGGPGQPANQVYPCFCQTPYAMACGETAQVRDYPEVAESEPLKISGRMRSGG
jgi:hypothetical protein